MLEERFREAPEVEADLIKSVGCCALVRREWENGLRFLGVLHDGHPVIGGKSVEQGVGGMNMAVLQEVNSGAGFDQQQNLGGLLDVGKVGQGLLSPVVHYMKISAAQSFDKLSTGTGDNHSHIHAVHIHANFCL